jgi:RHS repeat-associated protein
VVLARTERTFGANFSAYTFPEIGVWRAWTCLVGNMSARYRGAARLRLAERWFNTLDDGTSNMLLDVVREERVTGAYDESYTCNAIGNIAGKGPTGSRVSYGYNASGGSSVRPHAVTSVGGDVYAYDNNGNMTSRTGKAITWNADNTIASVVGPDNVPEGYTYDANGGRATRSRNLGQTGGFTTAYVGGLYEEDIPSGDKRVLYVFAGRVICQRSIPSGGGNGTVAYLHGEMLGSTGATTSAAGAVTATQRYTPFGAVRAGGSLPTAIDFTGQRRDGTGLLFYNARYYDPGLGRFISADTYAPLLIDAQSRNRYSYVQNNPIRYTDPNGPARPPIPAVPRATAVAVALPSIPVLYKSDREVVRVPKSHPHPPTRRQLHLQELLRRIRRLPDRLSQVQSLSLVPRQSQLLVHRPRRPACPTRRQVRGTPSRTF